MIVPGKNLQWERFKYTVLLFLFFLGLIWSGIHPRNQWHWLGEVAPAIIGLIILVKIYRRTHFTYFAYLVVLLACICLFVGGHYTFSRVPLFDWIKEITGSERNNFDKFGHFIQGMVPVILSREIFLTKSVVKRNWVGFLAFCIGMATTSVYEIIEYLSCLIAQKPLESFMGTQGFKWDSQSDMLFAVFGGLFVLFALKNTHNRLIEKEFPGTITSGKGLN